MEDTIRYIVPLKIAIFILVITLLEQACYKDAPSLIKCLMSIQYCMAAVMFAIAICTYIVINI